MSASFSGRKRGYSNSAKFENSNNKMATSGLGHEGIAAFRMELLSQTATASDIIVSKMEEYLMKVWKKEFVRCMFPYLVFRW